MAKFCQNLIPAGRPSLSRNSEPATGRVSDIRNSEINNGLEPFDGPMES
jgi:hypothetical protein